VEETQKLLLLSRLEPVHSASHDSNEAPPPCLPDTRTKLLADVARWMKDPSAKPVYWLTGVAGTEKSTVAQSVAAMAKEHGCLGGSFFFSSTDESAQRRRAVTVIPTISYQLARKLNSARTSLCHAVASDPDIRASGLARQAEVLLSGPLRAITNASNVIRENPLCTVAWAQVWSHESCHSSGACLIPLYTWQAAQAAIDQHSMYRRLLVSAEKGCHEQELNTRLHEGKSTC
jgi:hypothetical protein